MISVRSSHRSEIYSKHVTDLKKLAKRTHRTWIERSITICRIFAQNFQQMNTKSLVRPSNEKRSKYIERGYLRTVSSQLMGFCCCCFFLFSLFNSFRTFLSFRFAKKKSFFFMCDRVFGSISVCARSQSAQFLYSFIHAL